MGNAKDHLLNYGEACKQELEARIAFMGSPFDINTVQPRPLAAHAVVDEAELEEVLTEQVELLDNQVHEIQDQLEGLWANLRKMTYTLLANKNKLTPVLVETTQQQLGVLEASLTELEGWAKTVNLLVDAKQVLESVELAEVA